MLALPLFQVVVTEIVSGVSPVWGFFRLTFNNDRTPPIPVIASASAMQAALASLQTIGNVTVSVDLIGQDRYNRAGVTRTWCITFDQTYSYPNNLGDLPLLIATWDYDSTSEPLGYVASGQQPPEVEVYEVTRGEFGNHQDNPIDLPLLTMGLSHRSVPNVYIDMHETQTITCTATTGYFVLAVSTAVETRSIRVYANDTLLAFQTKLNNILTGLIANAATTVSFVNPVAGNLDSTQTTMCGISGQPIFVTFGNTRADIPPLTVTDSAPLSHSSDTVWNRITSVLVHEYVKGGVNVTYVADGLYSVTYVPVIKLRYSMYVKLSGVNIQNDLSAGIYVTPTQSDAIYSLHTAEPHAVENVLESFMIQTRDRFENELDHAVEGTNQYVVTLVGLPHEYSRQYALQAQGTPIVINADVVTNVPNTDGKYYVSYTPVVAGNYTLNVQYLRSGGLLATYYYNEDLTSPFPGRFPFCLPTNEVCEATQLDVNVDFNWGTLPALPAPAYVYPADYFSVSWTGWVQVPVTDYYVFHVYANGGLSLWINDTAAIDAWAISVAEPESAPMLLMAGEFYPITLNYHDDVGAAAVTLSWSSSSMAKTVVPSSALFNARHLRGSPMEVQFYPGAINASTSNAVGNGLIGGVAGDPFTFVVSSADNAGNQRYNTGADWYDVTVTAVDGWASINRVNDAWTGVPIQFSTFAGTVTLNHLDWTLLCSSCVSTSFGSTQLQVSTNVTTALRRGQRIAVNGETFIVHHTDPFTASLIPLQNPVRKPSVSNVDLYALADGELTGSHQVTYYPTIRGNYSVDVRVPRTSEIQTITLTSLANVSGTFIVGFKNYATAPLPYNVNATSLVSALQAAVPLFNNVAVNVSATYAPAAEFGAGVWTITFTAANDSVISTIDSLLVDSSHLSGASLTLEVAVVQDGQPSTPIGGSPWRIYVVPAVPNAAVTTAFGRGLVLGQAGEVSTFWIQSKDVFGNDRMEEQSRDLYEVLAFRDDAFAPFTETVVGAVSYVANGLYQAVFTPTIAPGSHIVTVCQQKVIEVQNIALTGLGVNQGGTFTLYAGLDATPKLAWDASVDEVQSALSALPSFGGAVTVSRNFTDIAVYFNVTFVSFVGDVPMLTFDDSELLPVGQADLVIVEVFKGTKAHIKTAKSPLVLEQQVVSVTFANTTYIGGTFELSVAGQHTDPLAWNAQANTVQDALRGLAFAESEPVVFVTRNGNAGNGYDYTILFSPIGPSYATPSTPTTEQIILATHSIGNLPPVGVVNNLQGFSPSITNNVINTVNGASPFLPTIITAAIDGPNCTTYANDLSYQQTNGLVTGVFDAMTYFRIQSRDRFHNAKPEGPVAEVQYLTVYDASQTAVTTNGTIVLEFGGAVTAPIPSYPLYGSVLEAALEALPTISDVTVTNTNVSNHGVQCAITFVSELGDVPDILVDSYSFPGNTNNATAVITSCNHYRVQTITTYGSSSAVLSGSFKLYYGNEVTGDLAYNIQADVPGAAVGTAISSVETTAGLKQVRVTDNCKNCSLCQSAACVSFIVFSRHVCSRMVSSWLAFAWVG